MNIIFCVIKIAYALFFIHIIYYSYIIYLSVSECGIFTPEAGVVEARVVVGDSDQWHSLRPTRRSVQRLAVVHRRLVQELCNSAPHTLQQVTRS